ncbi:Uncharacterised protein [Mycobacteroides abscessus subsp. abscessus]|nr:Uncharacterised protein [Mycobacteroides abscessus subsp. abscessus]
MFDGAASENPGYPQLVDCAAFAISNDSTKARTNVPSGPERSSASPGIHRNVVLKSVGTWSLGAGAAVTAVPDSVVTPHPTNANKTHRAADIVAITPRCFCATTITPSASAWPRVVGLVAG